MNRYLLFILGFLIAGCSPILGITQPLPSLSSAPVHAVTSSPSPLPPTHTPFSSLLTDTETPKVTSSETPTITSTETLTEIPTADPISWTYVFPIQPSSLAHFADDGMASHGYAAIDIYAPEGTKFVAVTDGVVDFVSNLDDWEPIMDDWSLRGGLSVAIIGDDGVRYFGSQLSAIESGIRPGVRVAVGQVLGYVGHSGAARSDDFHLHFGISHPTDPQDWRTRRGEVDPFLFLGAWCGGHNVTPPLPEIPVDTSQFIYVFPVQPIKNVSFTQGGHGYPATDIFAPARSQFVAVTAGVVDSVSYEDRWDPAVTNSGLSGGLWVSILGDDGVRYYGAHLSAIYDRIRVGTRVRPGDLLGLVGNSGDARDTQIHLHFQISRPTSASDWMSRDSLLDPFPFLQAWKAGQNVTPP